jgi:hypothetical protein
VGAWQWSAVQEPQLRAFDGPSDVSSTLLFRKDHSFTGFTSILRNDGELDVKKNISGTWQRVGQGRFHLTVDNGSGTVRLLGPDKLKIIEDDSAVEAGRGKTYHRLPRQ